MSQVGRVLRVHLYARHGPVKDCASSSEAIQLHHICLRLIVLLPRHMDNEVLCVGVAKLVAMMATLMATIIVGVATVLHRRLDELERTQTLVAGELRDRLRDLDSRLETAIAECRVDVASTEVHLNRRLDQFEEHQEELWDKAHDLELRVDTVEIYDDLWNLKLEELKRGKMAPTAEQVTEAWVLAVHGGPGCGDGVHGVGWPRR